MEKKSPGGQHGKIQRQDIAPALVIVLTPLAVGLGYAGLVSEQFNWVWHVGFVIASVGVLLAFLSLVMEAVRGSIRRAAEGNEFPRQRSTARTQTQFVQPRSSSIHAWRGTVKYARSIRRSVRRRSGMGERWN